MPKKLVKDIAYFTGTNVMVGAGGIVLGKMGSASGVNVGAGLSAASSMMPTVGSAMMLGHTVRIATKMMPKRRKHK